MQIPEPRVAAVDEIVHRAPRAIEVIDNDGIVVERRKVIIKQDNRTLQLFKRSHIGGVHFGGEQNNTLARLALYGTNLLIRRLTAVKIAHGKVVAERVGFFGDTLRKPLEKQGIPYHLAVTLIQNELQKSVCLVL